MRGAILVMAVLASTAGPVVAAVLWPECSESFHIAPPAQHSGYLACGAGALWLQDPDTSVIWKLSPTTGAVLGSIPSTYLGGIAFDGQYLWKAAYSSPTIRCIRPTDGSTVRDIPGVGNQQTGLAWDGVHVWIADESTQRIYQLDANTGAQLASFASPGPKPRGLAWWNGYLYHTDSHEERIYQIDPSTGEVVSAIATHGEMESGTPRGLAIDGDHLWYSDREAGIDRLVIDVSPDGRTIRSHPIAMLAEMTYRMTNTGTSTIEHPEAYWSVPVADSEHVIHEVTYTPAPDHYVVEASGETIAHFSGFAPVPPGGTAQIVCRAYETIWRVDYQINPEEVLPLSSIPAGIRDLYLADAGFLHITDPEIVAAAVSAIGTETNPYRMAIKLHDFVAEHMTYLQACGTNTDALVILRSAYGDCGSYSILYTALGRAVGLPTRIAMAFYCYENADSAGHHMWAEAYIPGYGWIPFDPTRDDRSPLRHRYVGCEPLGIVYFRNGGTDKSARGWRTGGAPRTESGSHSGTAALTATSCDASPGTTFGSTQISWRNPPAINLARVVVRRTTARYPASCDDGALVYEALLPGSAELSSVLDFGLDPSEEYYYAVFAQSGTGLWSENVVEGESRDRTYPAAVATSASFRVDGIGSVLADGSFYGASFRSGSADVAEWVPVSEAVEAGTVLELDTVHPGSYRPSQTPCSALVAGVVSTQPAITLGATPGGPQKALLALSGIVPVKVTNEGGPIQPGDLLVSSSTPGYAMRWTGSEPCPCALVGKAPEPMTDERGVISVLLTAH
jgi:transglutaminase-like putative cysteine protease